MYQGKPQKYGTNYVYDGRQDRLWYLLNNPGQPAVLWPIGYNGTR
jgi:N-acetylmuramoyl-L-alanine amidase